jgi:tRNA:m4X modification enzyme
MGDGDESNSNSRMRQSSYKNNKRKHLDIDNGITLVDLLKDHKACNYLIEHKKKLCGMTKTPGSNYCGLHRATVGETVPLSRAEKESSKGSESNQMLKRINCPRCNDSINPKRMNKHMTVCNVVSVEKKLSVKPYFRSNCNSGTVAPASTSGGSSSSSSTVDPDKLLSLIKDCFENHVHVDHTTFSNNSALTERERKVMQEVSGEQSSQNKLRHARQDALLVRQVLNRIINNNNNDNDNDNDNDEGKGSSSSSNVYVEMGAGAGALGYACHCADKRARLVFVEREATPKHCVDKTLRRNNLTHMFYRARMDIRDCLVSALPGVQEQQGEGEREREGGDMNRKDGKVVVIAKHLCGVASDLAINSVRDPALAKRDTGMVVATCCHHRCEWDDYAGRAWLQERGFTAADFALMRHWSGWGTGLARLWSGFKSSRKEEAAAAAAGDSKEEEEEEEEEEEGEGEEEEEEEEGDHVAYKPQNDVQRPKAITKEGMAQAGYMIKRILDQGRCEALRGLGFESEQVQFCSPRESPECFVVLAWPRALS